MAERFCTWRGSQLVERGPKRGHFREAKGTLFSSGVQFLTSEGGPKRAGIFPSTDHMERDWYTG